MPGLRLFKNGFLVGVGYLLSPLSWWNDLFFNFPIAWVFGYGFNYIHPGWLVPATVTGYWLSNVLGIVMMQWGATDWLKPEQPVATWRTLTMGIGASTLYTLVVLVLVYHHWLDLPAGLLP
jgi:hypothetical protein